MELCTAAPAALRDGLARVLLLVLVAGGPVPALAKSKSADNADKAHKGKPSLTAALRASRSMPLPPPQIELRGFDLEAGQAHVLVSGCQRPPESRVFVFTDERQRRFVPSLSDCHPPEGLSAQESVKDEAAEPEKVAPPAKGDGPEQRGAAGRWQCALFIPRIYQRATLTGLSVEVRGQTVSVPDSRVQRSWAEARARTPLKAVAERPRPPSGPWGPRRAPDAGPTVDSDGVDPETEE